MKTPTLIAGAAAAVPILSDSALKSVAVLLLVGAIVLSLRKASAATRHTIWIFAMIGLLALPLLSFTLPKWSALPASFQIAVPPVEVEPTAAPAMAPRPLPTDPIAHTTSPVEAMVAPATSIDLGSALVLLWAGGAVLLLLRLVLSHWLLQALARSSRIEPALQARFDHTRSSLEIPGNVSLRISSNSIMPQTFGFFRPCVVLPSDAVNWTPSRLQAVLAHELGHIKRRDPLSQLLVQFVCAIYWFNPLVWLAARQIESDRERACDDLVLNHGVKASDYAQHLLEVVTGCDDDRFTACASVGMARPSRLEGRVVSILDDRVNRRSITRALLAVTLIATAVAIVPLAMIEAQAKQPPEAIAANAPSPRPIDPEPPTDDRLGTMNPIDRLLHQRLKQEGIDLTQLKDPEKLTPAQRLNMIRAFYRFFLKRHPSVDELKAADANWSQSDYYRWAESLAGQTFPSGALKPPPAPAPVDIGLANGVSANEAVAADPEAWPRAFASTKDSSGQLLWSTQMPGNKRYGQPVARNGRIYIMDENGCLHCLDSKTGKLLWNESNPGGITDEFVARAYQDLNGRRPKSKTNKLKLLRDLSAKWRVRMHPKAPPQPGNDSVAMADGTEALQPDRVVPSSADPAAIPSEATRLDTTLRLRKPPIRTPGGGNPTSIEAMPAATPPLAAPINSIPIKKRFRPEQPAVAEPLSPFNPRPIPPSPNIRKNRVQPIPTMLDAAGDPIAEKPALAPQVPTVATTAPRFLDTGEPAPAVSVTRTLHSNTVSQSTVVRDQQRELAKHWRDLVSAREQIRDSVKKRQQSGLASSSELNQADQALTESRIGLAKASDSNSQIVKYLKELVSLREHRFKRQETLFKQGFVSENDLLQAREKLIESKIRLAEAVIGNKSGRGLPTP